MMVDQLIVDLVEAFQEDHTYLARSQKLLDEELSHVRDKRLATEVLRELFLRPYLSSTELSEKLAIGIEDLKGIYSFIRSSRKVTDLFQFSPYRYLIKTLEDLTKDSEHTLKIIKGEMSIPPSKTMELFISASCNANCEFCYRNGRIYDEDIMSTPQFLDLIDQFADLGGQNLDISGGLEPLLGPSILEVLKRALARRLKVTLYTNGIALDNPSLLEYLLRIDKVRVSLNAADKESYRRLMGVDEFDTVKNNLATLIKERGKRNGSRIGISFVVYGQNYAQIPIAIILAQQWGVDFIDLRSVHVTAMSDFDQKHQEELKLVLKQVKRGILIGAYGNLSVSVADTFNSICGGNGLVLRRDFVDDLPRFRVTVTPQGRVYALNVIGQPTREDPKCLLGDFNSENDLPTILRNKKHIPFEPDLFMPHDISLIVALTKLKADMELGIGLDECPFNFKA